MSMKDNQEQFHSKLLEQYRELIQEAFLECETDCRTHLDVEALDKRLQNIVNSARFEGISVEEVGTLIDEVKRLTAYDSKVA